MKKNAPKLSLSKETVQNLTLSKGAVAGAVTTQPTSEWCTLIC